MHTTEESLEYKTLALNTTVRIKMINCILKFCSLLQLYINNVLIVNYRVKCIYSSE